MDVLFLGSGAFGLPTLERLAKGKAHRLVGVVTQPDRPAGRGKALTATPVGAWASEQVPGVPLLKVENINALEVCAEVRARFGPRGGSDTARVGASAVAGGETGADAWVVIAFGQRLSEGLLAGVRAVNLHASLLPRWRGAAPIHAAILAGDRETGNSVITLAQRMDAGLVLAQSRREIEPSLTTGELHDLLAADGPDLVCRTLDGWLGGTLHGEKQDERLVTKAVKLSKADGWVDFSGSADEVRRRVHGLNPWPGVSVTIGGENVKLLRVGVQQEGVRSACGEGGETGTLVDAVGGVVACGHGSRLAILSVQPAGGRAMAWAAFAAGRRLANGTQVKAGRP